MLLLKSLVLILGILIVIWVLLTAVRTFILPRGENAFLSRQVFRITRRVFLFFARRAKSYYGQDRILSFYSPIVLLLLPVTYLVFIMLGYTCIHWALGAGDGTLYTALLLSGSSMLTLGFAPVTDIPTMLASFSDAAIGLILVAVLIAYLPTIYAAFSAREKRVSMLDVNAGTPPTATEMLLRIHRNRGGFDYFRQLWREWEEWFVEIEENHTSLIALVFLRSPVPERHWLTASGAVLDCASLLLSTVDTPSQIEGALCIRAGYLSLRRIANFFNLSFQTEVSHSDEISITREEYDEVVAQLRQAGVPIKADIEQAWRDFRGWRVNYDRPLLGLCRLVTAPYAPWSSDRAFPDMAKIIGL